MEVELGEKETKGRGEKEEGAQWVGSLPGMQELKGSVPSRYTTSDLMI